MVNIVIAWAIMEIAAPGIAMFQYWTRCLREKALSTWESVELVHFPGDDVKTPANFKRAYVLYLEKLAKMTWIGNSVIHRVLNWKKSVVMCTQ